MEPTLDIVTGDELHEALVHAVLKRNKSIKNVDEFMANNAIESKVAYRNVRQTDGSIQLMAAVSITKVTPSAASVAPPAPSGSEGKDG